MVEGLSLVMSRVPAQNKTAKESNEAVKRLVRLLARQAARDYLNTLNDEENIDKIPLPESTIGQSNIK